MQNNLNRISHIRQSAAYGNPFEAAQLATSLSRRSSCVTLKAQKPSMQHIPNLERFPEVGNETSEKKIRLNSQAGTYKLADQLTKSFQYPSALTPWKSSKLGHPHIMCGGSSIAQHLQPRKLDVPRNLEFPELIR